MSGLRQAERWANELPEDTQDRLDREKQRQLLRELQRIEEEEYGWNRQCVIIQNKL